MIEYIKGDVTLADEFVILQGCNAQGKMNSGVAKAIRDKWPEVFAQYDFTATTLGLALGDIHPCFVYHVDRFNRERFPTKVIINGITQQYYGRDPNVVYVDYNAIRYVLHYTKELLVKMGQTSIAMPKIGAGLGNGDWNRIETIIDQIMPDIWVKIYVPE
jgi:O-acetyl-ADP-ribose deacetylase (regulator of RNase III)